MNDSSSFSETHEIISLMSAINNWEYNQIKRILEIGTLNSQVKYILKDIDIMKFYKKISNGIDDEYAKIINKLIKS